MINYIGYKGFDNDIRCRDMQYEILLDEVLNNKISKYYPALSDTSYAWSYYEKY